MPEALKNTFERHGFYVSRETLEKMAIYSRLLEKWQKAINLVGPLTLTDIPERHFFDSAQMFRYITNVDAKLADLGSGAGFPGMVLAMLGVRDVHLVESDVRKATFLREVSRETNTPVTILDARAEAVVIPGLDVITARAMAPLKDLLVHMDRLTTKDHAIYGLFAKGLQHQEEIDKARKLWDFEVELFPSETDLSGKILRVKNLTSK
ncbi:MAG: 16S rRNA (guanine(527)-N(7))-methyltransferase RsmG [Alphaproteobacteria bacterium]